MGYLPVSFNLDGDESIWIHAVSVGEALTARALISDLRDRYPGLRLYLSTTTLTGQQIARTRLQGVDAVFFFPFDLPAFVNRTLRLVRPRVFVMMETEIWPNLLRACRRQGVKTVLVNGRISSRSYPRYRLARRFFKQVLADVDRFCMQSDESSRRIIDIGADPKRVTVTGSLKFDSLESPAAASGRGAGRVLRFFRVPASRPVIVAGSTLNGEERAVLAAFAAVRRAHPSTLLVIAPRKPERFGEAEALARAEGLRVMRRTELAVDAEPRADVVILDTIGELAHLFQAATVVFIGGSIVDQGGHNILEPAVHGKPIVFGPYMQNFAEIAETFLKNKAAIQVSGQGELADVLVRLIGDPVERASLAAAARALVEANRGAKQRTLAVMADLLPPPGERGVVRPFKRV
jgi:3-deoxy-D-manno-octulosonic-acid transferase